MNCSTSILWAYGATYILSFYLSPSYVHKIVSEGRLGIQDYYCKPEVEWKTN